MCGFIRVPANLLQTCLCTTVMSQPDLKRCEENKWTVLSEPSRFHRSTYVGLKRTYAVVGLSSRFNRVGVIAIKKHPSEKEKEVGEERAVIPSFWVVIINASVMD